MSRPSKQAIVYIIDSSPSMAQPYPNSDTEDGEHADKDSDGQGQGQGQSQSQSQSQSRLSAAKEALEGLITSVMIQSKTNEVGVIVLRTRDTDHHLCPLEERQRQRQESISEGQVDPSEDNDDDDDDDDNVGKFGNGDNAADNVKNDKDEEEKGSGLDLNLDLQLVYPNIIELSPVQRPSIDLLRQIRKIEIADVDADSDRDANANARAHKPIPHRSGGFCDGIMLAADAIYKRTNGKRFQRKIILLTDAEREVEIRWEDLDEVVEGLRDMECELTVVGLDFTMSAKFEHAAPLDIVSSANDVVVLGNDGDNSGGHDNSNNKSIGESEDDNMNVEKLDRDAEKKRLAMIKSDNEMFLVSLTKYTGGSVHAANTIQQILNDTMGKRIAKSTLQKVEFLIAPGLSVSARMSLSTKKESIPSLKRYAVMLDENGAVEKNALGETMTLNVMNSTSHLDADDNDEEVELNHRANGYPYGSDLIPIGPLDLEGLKFRSPPMVTILGYTTIESIPMSQWMGPTRILSGDADSRKACLAISALSQALDRLDRMAICRYVGRKDAEPLMGILLPLIEIPSTVKDKIGEYGMPNRRSKPRHLVFVQFPFADDIQNLEMHPLDEAVGGNKANETCDNLIDAFLLPPDIINCENTPNPAIRSFRKTKIQRAVSPSFDGTVGARDDGNDPMCTPPAMVIKGGCELKNFRRTFPLEVVGSGLKKKQKKFWSDTS
uniref:Ku domain-containing protein n=1 Tax=Chaetoceros debilis TaxID=122233 RepID=A0A7S3V9B7_9STRA